MKVLLGTNNKGRVRYYSRKLKERGIDIVTPRELGIHIDVEETGETSRENAILKAKAYQKLTDLPVIAIDDALYLEGLPEELQPKTHVKRIGGRELSDSEMITYYHELVKTYGTDGVLPGYYWKGVAVAYQDQVYAFDTKEYRYFVDTISEVLDPDLPLASIQMIYLKGKPGDKDAVCKYKSELTEEEERISMDVIHQPVFEFLEKTMAEIAQRDCDVKSLRTAFTDCKIIMLDVDNTLLDFNLCTISDAEKVAKSFGITLPEHWDGTFHRINDQLWLDLENEKITLEGIHAIRWIRVLSALGIPHAEEIGVDFEKAFVEQLKYEAIPVEGAMELLQYLKEKGYELAVASNGPWEQQFNRLTQAGMLELIGEENLFTSGDIGISKPQKGFFDACLKRLAKRLGRKPELSEIVMIGDSLTADIGGAKDSGLATIWFDYDNKGVKAPGAEKADCRVEKLQEIMGLI